MKLLVIHLAARPGSADVDPIISAAANMVCLALIVAGALLICEQLFTKKKR